MKKLLIALEQVVAVTLLIIVFLGALHFPYDTDAPLTQQEIAAARKYYADAYRAPVLKDQVQTDSETEYIRITEAADRQFRIQEQVSATALPFPDDSFEGVWSIWVLEHVPNPEQALLEARRVIRDNGIIFLLPAWNSAPWLAQGYAVRPYADFDLGGKLIKASIPVRSSPAFAVATLIPIRVVRSVAAWLGPTRLRYRRLSPNYAEYWMPDSDAVNSIDRHEAAIWFLSRGDDFLNCEKSLFEFFGPLIIRVHKSIS